MALYKLTREDLDSVTEPEVVFGTTRLLPEIEQIPDEFHAENIYTRLVQALLFQQSLPEAELTFRPGFEDEGAAAALNRCVRAHLQSFSPRHEHKVAGVGFMISKVCEVKSSSS